MTFDEFWKHYVGGDKDKSLETGRIYAESAWNYQQARIEALRAEVEEQARLLGTSASREAELLARVEALEKKLTKVYNALLAGIANAAAANYAEREMEAKRRLRDAMQEPSP